MKKAESTKIIPEVLIELLIRNYERFKYFSQTRNLALSKNTSVKHRKTKHHEKYNFGREKITKSETPT